MVDPEHYRLGEHLPGHMMTEAMIRLAGKLLSQETRCRAASRLGISVPTPGRWVQETGTVTAPAP